MLSQIYRKAAFRIVKDLGEDVFPEPSTVAAAVAKEQLTETPTTEENAPAFPASEAVSPSDEVKTVLNTTPESGSAAEPSPETNADERKTVTTIKRQPLQVPSSVSVTITTENLKDYVGPQIYHKDRFYTKAPPAGVSTGLGYLGNGSGAVMPVEAMVRNSLLSREMRHALNFFAVNVVNAREGRPPADWKAWGGHTGERPDCIELGEGTCARA